MSEPEQPESRSQTCSWLVVIGLLLAYPLSIGPATWLWDNGLIDIDNLFWRNVYLPLVWIAGDEGFLYQAFVWYQCLWIG